MTTRNNSFLLTASAIMLGSPLAPVSAEEFTATGSRGASATVSIADLDLASPAGTARLNGRIRSAAGNLCWTSDVEPLPMRIARAKCFRTALLSGLLQAQELAAARGGPSARAATANSPKTGG